MACQKPCSGCGTDHVSPPSVERVKAADDPFATVIKGVDEPWDVALVELWLREIRRSAKGNIDELQANGKLF